MKIVLFDDILETHVRKSLSDALIARGHDVIMTRPLWKGHRFPESASDLETIRNGLSEAMAQDPDLILNFRASTLTPEMVRDARTRGIKTAVWLPDDPVLYEVCYRHVVDRYDLVLGCGNAAVLDLYARNHGIRSVNFPFWTGADTFVRPATPIQDRPDDFAFLGNLKGQVRSERYRTLEGLPGRVSIYGRLDHDPSDLGRGYLQTEAEIAQALGRAKFGINIPQFFHSYRGLAYDFPELPRLGAFQFPSRVIQYAACGLPVVTLGQHRAPASFPEMICGRDVAAIGDQLDRLMSDPDMLQDLSTAVFDRFASSFSANSRAAFLERLMEAPDDILQGDLHTRENAFAGPDAIARAKARTSAMPPTLPIQIAELANKAFKDDIRYRILHIGSFAAGSTDIVACLLRALTNLGHIVNHVDVSGNAGIFPEGRRGRGGYGPNALDYDDVARYAKCHAAQIIVLNADGLCFSDGTAARLKADGFVLIGLTLSDPDVQASIIDHVGAFDLHFTNSAHALKGYEAAGLRNTHLMPFGIDLNFIQETIPNDPGFQADVICLGHATNRQDRIDAMTAVRAEVENVRLYGRGWPVADSRPVAGHEMLQASRGGLIHVNFPRTMAGYRNVKCGVFETVGNGGILLTDRFAEMATYFDYDAEIAGYDDTEDLVQSIKFLLANPDHREEMRRRAFKRLAEDHLYEHRWMAAFERLRDEAAGRGQAFSAARAAQINDILTPVAGDRTEILLTGFYGHGNLGDELIMKTIIDTVTARCPNVCFTIATVNATYIQKRYGLAAVSLKDVAATARIADQTDVALLGGGGLWHDYTFAKAGGVQVLFDGTAASIGGYARPAIMAKGHGAAFHVLGLGVGPLTDPRARAFVKFIGDQTDTITVRDRTSADILNAIDGWSQAVSVAPDLVYALDLSSTPSLDTPASRRRLVLNLRPWAGADMDAFLDRLAEVLRPILADHPHDVICLPMQLGAAHDTKILTEFMARLGQDAGTVFQWNGNPDEALAVIRSADAVIAMRLHACLLAHRFGKPAVGLAYDPKVTEHFSELGRRDRALGMDSGKAAMAATLRALLSGRDRLSSQTVTALRDLETSGKSQLLALADRIGPDATLQSLKAASVSSGSLGQVMAPRLARISTPMAYETNGTTPHLRFQSSLSDLNLNPLWTKTADPHKSLSLAVDFEGILSGSAQFATGNKTYLKMGAAPFDRPMEKPVGPALTAGDVYRFSICLERSSDAVEILAWVIQYDDVKRLSQTIIPLLTGFTDHEFRCHPDTRSMRLAFRVAGKGTFRLHPVRIYRQLW